MRLKTFGGGAGELPRTDQIEGSSEPKRQIAKTRRVETTGRAHLVIRGDRIEKPNEVMRAIVFVIFKMWMRVAGSKIIFPQNHER